MKSGRQKDYFSILISFPTPQAGQAFAKKQALRYKVNGSAEMTDQPLVRA